MAEQLPRLCQQFLLPRGVRCWNPEQSERIIESLSPVFFCSAPFPSSMTTVLAEVQFSRGGAGAQVIQYIAFFFW